MARWSGERRWYGLKESELAGPRRQRRLAEARGVVAGLTVTHGSATMTALAQQFNRDLSAIRLAVSRTDAKQRESGVFQAQLRQ